MEVASERRVVDFWWGRLIVGFGGAELVTPLMLGGGRVMVHRQRRHGVGGASFQQRCQRRVVVHGVGDDLDRQRHQQRRRQRHRQDQVRQRQPQVGLAGQLGRVRVDRVRRRRGALHQRQRQLKQRHVVVGQRRPLLAEAENQQQQHPVVVPLRQPREPPRVVVVGVLALHLVWRAPQRGDNVGEVERPGALFLLTTPVLQGST